MIVETCSYRYYTSIRRLTLFLRWGARVQVYGGGGSAHHTFSLTESVAALADPEGAPALAAHCKLEGVANTETLGEMIIYKLG